MRAYLRDKETGQLIQKEINRNEQGQLVTEHGDPINGITGEIVELKGWPDTICEVMMSWYGDEWLVPTQYMRQIKHYVTRGGTLSGAYSTMDDAMSDAHDMTYLRQLYPDAKVARVHGDKRRCNTSTRLIEIRLGRGLRMSNDPERREYVLITTE